MLLLEVMKRIKWSDQYKVHLPEIDAEHRSLYHTTEMLQQAVEGEAGNERIAAILQEAFTHISGHFAHEERLMEATEFPGGPWHKRQHDAAARRVMELADRIRGGDEAAAQELVTYMGRWLKDHIGLADRMMAAHLRNWERLHTRMAS